MAQGTAASALDHADMDAARSVVMAALGQSEDSAVETDDAGDTNATSTAADDVEDSDESADIPEEAEEGAESDDAEPAEEIETKGIEEDSPFSAADKAAIAADPKLAKLAKGLQKSYTSKMQELGEVRKFREQLKGDPQTVLQRIAEANGLKVSFGESKAAAPTAPQAPPQVPETIAAVAAGVRAKWVPIIGEEATDQLLSGMQEIVTAATGAAVGPILKANGDREQATLVAQTQAEFDRFATEHPDWKNHEAAMQALGARIAPQNMSAYEYTKFLYDNVTRGQQIVKAKVEAAAKVAAKVKRAATDAEPAPRTRIPGKGVKDTPKTYATPEDAVRASLAELGFSA